MTGQDQFALIGGAALLAIVVYGFLGLPRIKPSDDPPSDHGASL